MKIYRIEDYFMPNEQRRQEIEKQVNEIITEYKLYEPGFDLVQFLSEKENFKISIQSMPPETMGALLINDREYIQNTSTHKLISVNSSLQNEPNYGQRLRFICAHEYAHSIIHKTDDVELYAHRDTDKRDEQQEKEADFFARCLLMPRNAVMSFLDLDIIKTLDYKSKISLMARVFNVTTKKASQRLREDLKIEC